MHQSSRTRNAANRTPPAEIQAFVAEAEKIKAEMRDLQSRGQLGEVSAATLQSQLDRMEAVVGKASGEEGRHIRASFAVARKLLQAQIRSTAPMERFHELGGMEMSGVTSKNEIAKRLVLVQECRKHIAETLEIAKNWRSVLVEGGKAEGITAAEITRLIAPEAADLEAKMRHERSIHELELEAADNIISTLDLLRDEWGAWRVDDEDKSVVFEDETTVKRFNKFMEKLGEIEEKQTSLIKQSLRPRS